LKDDLKKEVSKKISKLLKWYSIKLIYTINAFI
jgi:hypothetical protein